MKQITIEGFIHTKKESWGDNEYYIFLATDMTDFGYVKLQPHTLTVDLKPYDINALAVINLNKKLKLIKAEHFIKTKAIEDEIQSLLSIENKE